MFSQPRAKRESNKEYREYSVIGIFSELDDISLESKMNFPLSKLISHIPAILGNLNSITVKLYRGVQLKKLRATLNN